MTERRACRLVGQHRSTQRYRTKPDEEEEERLAREIRRLSRKHRRYGYRRITELLRRKGWIVNVKRVHRLWKREGLGVARRSRRHRAVGSSEAACGVTRAERPNQVWTYDFLSVRLRGGRRVRVLTVLDEYTRECLALHVASSIPAEVVIAVLALIMTCRGAPEAMRSDNGPEFVAKAVRDWLAAEGTKTLYIAPGSPWENGVVEAFHARLRDEFLNGIEIENVREARALFEAFRKEYNAERPHSSLGYRTPREFAEIARRVAEEGSAPLRPPLPLVPVQRPLVSSTSSVVP